MKCLPTENVSMELGFSVLPSELRRKTLPPGRPLPLSVNVTEPDANPNPDLPATSARTKRRLPYGPLENAGVAPVFKFSVKNEVVVVLGSGNTTIGTGSESLCANVPSPK